jgi:hypothetical protein
MEEAMGTLKFSGRLDNLRRLKGWTFPQMAKKIWGDDTHSGHLEYLLSGKHQPLAYDIVLIERRLDVQFDPEDFSSEEMPEKKL